MDYLQEPAQLGKYQGASVMRQPTVLEQLQFRKLELEEQLNQVNKALTAMQSYPDICEVLDVLAKACIRL